MQDLTKPFFYKERIAFIGDASSGCSPTLQQGAASAFDDGVALVSSLKSHGEINHALSAYKGEREQLVKWIMQNSDAYISKMPLMSKRYGAWLRDIVLRVKGPVNFNGWINLAKKL